MKTHLEQNSSLIDKYTPLFIWRYVTFYYACMQPVVENNVCWRGRTSISTESAELISKSTRTDRVIRSEEKPSIVICKQQTMAFHFDELR